MTTTLHLEGGLFVADLLEKIGHGQHTSQSETDYQLPKGVKLDDEIGRAFNIARAQWRDFDSVQQQRNVEQTTRNFMHEFLTDALGYSIRRAELAPSGSPFLTPPDSQKGRLPLILAPHNIDLDSANNRFIHAGFGQRRKSATQFAQELLNSSEEHLWALVTNGINIRLLRENASLTRPAYIDFDLAAILGDTPRYPDFKVLWRILHASRAGVGQSGDANCHWENWRKEGYEQGTRVRAALRQGVTRALIQLGDGFLSHPDNNSLRAKLRNGTLTINDYFLQLLRTVYRFLFIFTIEERGILHPQDANPDAMRIYREGYALRRLRPRALRRSAYDRHSDLWQGITVVLQGLDKGEPLLGLPPLGGLFSQDNAADLDSATLANRSLLSAMYSLRWTKSGAAIAPVDYRNMGPEELGSVYESLLELVPTLDLPARKFGFIGITDSGSTDGNTRKTTGSYYTPDSLVQELVKSALDPVIESRLREVGNGEVGNGEVGNGEVGNGEVGNGEVGNREVGNREVGNGEVGNREVGNRNGGKENEDSIVQRFAGLAEGDGVERNDLSSNTEVSAGGAVRSDFTNSPGNSINPSQHCGGLGTAEHRRLHTFSEDSSGQCSRAGDRTDSSATAGIDLYGSFSGGSECNSRCAENVAQPNPLTTKQKGSQGDGAGIVGCNVAAGLSGNLPTSGNVPTSGYVPIDYVPQSEKALLSLTVIDPACGSGHFLLAAARRIAEKLAQVRAGTDGVKPADYRRALRDVVTNCIYGVDLNPMALELAKISLWLEAYEPGRPLSFLDHHLVCGNALLGISHLDQLANGIPNAAFKALSGDDKEHCKRLTAINRAALKNRGDGDQGDLFQQTTDDYRQRLIALEEMPSDTPAEIAAKDKAHRELLAVARQSSVAAAADLFVGAFLLPKEADSPVPTSTTLFDALDQSRHDEEYDTNLTAAQDACNAARVLHWPLTFTHIFEQGGFDCVLANPPWERIKLQEEEFFAFRYPDIAKAPNKAARGRLIDKLAEGRLMTHLNGGHDESISQHEIDLYQEFIRSRRESEAVSLFAHLKEKESGRFPLTGIGDVNTYALFAETILQISKSEGRSGFIVPSGIASDDSTKHYFSHITQNNRLVSLLDFENKKPLFTDVHRMFKFSLVTIGDSSSARFAFFMTDPSELADERRFFGLTSDEFRLINPNTLTCPVFRSQRDAELTKKIYHNSAVLIDETDEDDNPWGVSFKTMFHMSNDSGLFHDAPVTDALPLYEAKLIHQFDHRWGTYEYDQAKEESECRDATDFEKADPAFAVTPRYWVGRRQVLARLAAVPSAVAKAYSQEDIQALRIAVANWLISDILADNLLLNPETVVAATFGKDFLKSLGRNWYDEKFKTGGVERLSESELSLLNSEPDTIIALDDIMDQRSPRWLMGWRDICRAVDERTVIASVIPRMAVGDKFLLIFSQVNDTGLKACLLADQNSLVHDYVARQKIGGTNLKYFTKRQIVMLPPDRYTQADLDFIVPRVLELTYTSYDMKPWAQDLGYDGEPFGFDPARRSILRNELDVWYANLYGLTKDELRYILDPTSVAGPDYPSETFRVLKDRELRTYGEYRTQRLVLEAWERWIEKPMVVKPAVMQKTVRLPVGSLSQTFPSEGLEQFMYELVAKLVAANPGEKEFFYRYAAALAVMPDELCNLVPDVELETRYLVRDDWKVRWSEIFSTLIDRQVIILSGDGTMEVGNKTVRVQTHSIEASIMESALKGAEVVAAEVRLATSEGREVKSAPIFKILVKAEAA